MATACWSVVPFWRREGHHGIEAQTRMDLPGYTTSAVDFMSKPRVPKGSTDARRP